MVLVKDPDAAVFEPRYQPNFRVPTIFGNNRIEVQDKKGHKFIRRSSHVKYIELSEKTVQQLPSEQVLKKYGRTSKLLLAAKDVLNLQFDVAESEGKNEPLERVDVMEIMPMTISKSVIAIQNSEFREHSKKSLESAAGEALGQNNHQGIVKMTVNSEPHKKTSECREHFQKSRISEVTAVVKQAGEVVPWMIKMGVHIRNSKDREPSQNSQVQEARTDTRNVDVSVVNCCGQYSTRVSEV